MDTSFTFYELNDRANVKEYSSLYGIASDRFIISSDAHYLTDMRDKENYFEIEDELQDPDAIRRRLFQLLRRK